MGEKSRKWIDEHREYLEKKYDDKIVIVSENKVMKVLDGDVDIIEVNDIARSLCQGKDWSWTYLGGEDEYLL